VVWPEVPFAVANTWKVWLPFARPEYDVGLVQETKAAASILHENVAGVIDEWKVNDADVLAVGEAGFVSIVTLGLGAA
jgi:hypothetical protein